MVILLLIPMTLASLAALLVLSESLERRSTGSMARMSMRSERRSLEADKSIVARELGRRLDAAGLGRRPVGAVAVAAFEATRARDAMAATRSTEAMAATPPGDAGLRRAPVPVTATPVGEVAASR